ncbi:major facilitator superfamily domain-containing protein, partial [Phascolomyces articulosus]
LVCLIIGVLQDYYEQNMFGSSREISMNLSFVGTLIQVMEGFMMPFSQILEVSIGLRPALIVSSTFFLVGLISASFCTEIWQLYLSLGLCVGIGCSIMLSVSLRIIPQWFDMKRSKANAVAFSGSVVSGLITPFMMTSINYSLGIAWTYRILAFIFVGFDIVICYVMREFDSTKKRERSTKNILPSFDFSLIRNKNNIIWVISCIPQAAVNALPYIFIPVYATYIGLTPMQGSTAVAILSGVNIFGRLGAGYVADKIGNMNTYIICNFLSCVSALLIWTFAYNYAILLVFAIFYGLFGNAYHALLGPATARVVGIEKLPSANTFISIVTSPAYFGPSIASSIAITSTRHPFLTYKLFLGLPLFFSVVVMIFLKFRMTSSVFSKI